MKISEFSETLIKKKLEMLFNEGEEGIWAPFVMCTKRHVHLMENYF